jgi:hypothetical protein
VDQARQGAQQRVEQQVYCVYIADSEKDVKEHAQKGGFPANTISTVRAVIDPATAE